MPSLGCYVLVFVDMLQSSDWNHSVKPVQIGLDGAWGSPPPPPPPQLQLTAGCLSSPVCFQASY